MNNKRMKNYKTINDKQYKVEKIPGNTKRFNIKKPALLCRLQSI
jgi:hypothetical protein